MLTLSCEGTDARPCAPPAGPAAPRPYPITALVSTSSSRPAPDSRPCGTLTDPPRTRLAVWVQVMDMRSTLDDLPEIMGKVKSANKSEAGAYTRPCFIST